jgi:multidrug resistance efflux pump
VSGRDFVTERLAERRRPLILQRELGADRARRYQQLADSGLVTARELKAVRIQVAQAKQELAALEKRIELRASFVAGDLSSTEVELQGMQLDAVAALETVVCRLEVLVQERDRLSLLSERGLVSASELEAVEAELREAEAQLQLFDLEKRLLDQKLEQAATE